MQKLVMTSSSRRNTPTFFFFFRCLHPAFVQACECIYQKPVRSAPLSIVAPAKSGRYINKRDFPGGRKGQKFAFFAKVFFFLAPEHNRGPAPNSTCVSFDWLTHKEAHFCGFPFFIFFFSIDTTPPVPLSPRDLSSFPCLTFLN